jgi:hypothetical protein
MAEDGAPIVKARLAGLCRTHRRDLTSVPIHVITTPVLRLDRGRDQARLRAAVRQLAPGRSCSPPSSAGRVVVFEQIG